MTGPRATTVNIIHTIKHNGIRLVFVFLRQQKDNSGSSLLTGTKVGQKIPSPVIPGGIYRYFPAWQIRP